MRQHVFPFTCDESPEPRADAVVHEWVVEVGLHHGGVVRQILRLQPVAERQVWPKSRQPANDGALPGGHVDCQGRCRKHYAVGNDEAAGDGRRHHQTAETVAQHRDAVPGGMLRTECG